MSENKRPKYILVATPVDATKVSGLFTTGPGSARQILENPKTFRHNGFDLDTRSRANIVDGECLETSLGDRKRLRLYEDGTFIVQGAADYSFLGWGPYEPEFNLKPRLNSIAIIEFTSLFIYTYKEVLKKLEPNSSKIKLHMEFRNGAVGNQRLYMSPYAVGSIEWMFNEDSHKLVDKPKAEIFVSCDSIMQDVDHVAYQLVEKLYLLFGMFTNMIPYTANERINVAALIGSK